MFVAEAEYFLHSVFIVGLIQIMPKFFQFKISGVVQGVGFRPYVLREARKLDLKGFVQNVEAGVLIVANDKERVLEILKHLPVLASVDEVMVDVFDVERVEISDVFEIRESVLASSQKVVKKAVFGMPSDVAICETCKNELLDPENRRYQYFHTSCTDCGPRFALVRGSVFDRGNTAMNSFVMCRSCRDEYLDPENRRFHMQGICCEACGPVLCLNGDRHEAHGAVRRAAAFITSGEIVAVKGVGGFVLVCGMDFAVVRALRARLFRKDKPFAVMGKDLDMIKKYVHISVEEQSFLSDKKAAIVLLKKRREVSLNHISENNRLGFLLPYMGLHHLLFQYLKAPIVFTSSNFSNIPITTKRCEQFVKNVLDYDRDIINCSDDSVVKWVKKCPLLVRRSRGYVPEEIKIPANYQTFEGDILALGAEQKSGFALKRGQTVLLSQDLGNTAYLENLKNYEKTLSDFLSFTGAKPKVILCDLNDRFNISRFGEVLSRKWEVPLVQIQHHRAHVFSVAMEHGLKDFIGIAADGVGMGDDGKVWGGEVFHGKTRIGQLENQVLIGGDVANKDPVRVLVGILSSFLEVSALQDLLPSFSLAFIKNLMRQKKENFNCIESSSAARVLDSVAVLLGSGEKNDYEGRCVQLLESMGAGLPFMDDVAPLMGSVLEKGDWYVLNTTKLFEFIVATFKRFPRASLAILAQRYLVEGFWAMAKKYNSNLPVVWGGGCAYNEEMSSFMISKGVLVNRMVPCGDGGIAFGQVGCFLGKGEELIVSN